MTVKIMRSAGILFLLFYLNFGSSYSQHPGFKFQNLTIDQGLSVNTISGIVKDQKGFIWFATPDGLNRYDGYTFKVFKNNPSDPGSIRTNQISTLYLDSKGELWLGTSGSGLGKFIRESETFQFYQQNDHDEFSISNDDVTAIYEDKAGRLWIGTYWGLNLLDPVSGKFQRFFNGEDSSSLSSSGISSMVEDHEGNFWVGTYDAGLNHFNRNTFTSTRFLHEPGNSKSLSDNFINTLFVDSKGRLWIGTNSKGLELFRTYNNTFKHFQHNPQDYNSLSGNKILCLEEDGQGNLWIGTEGSGLNLFNMKDSIFYDFWTNLSRSGSLKSNTILSLFQDRVGILWIGTSAGGVNMLDKNLPAFEHLKTNDGTLSINGFAEDLSGKIWVATDGMGVDLFDKASHEVTHIRHNGTSNSLSNNGIISLLSDRNGNIWLGTYQGGLNFYNIKNKTFTHYDEGKDAHSLSNNSVYALMEDKNDNIWIATLGGGVNVLDKETNTITRHIHTLDDPNSISSNYISSFLEDREGNIWLGSYSRGLNLFDSKNSTFIKFSEITGYKGLNKISTLHEDRNGNLWIGTFGEGFYLFDRKQNSLKAFREEDGLPNDVVNGIEEDNNGNLWISTNKGLSKFNIKKETFKNYDVEDGLQSYEFRRWASLKTRNGELLFGGINGFNIFHPDSIRDNPHIPPVVLTDFQIFNRPVSIGGKDSPLKASISETKELVLSYLHSVFTFEFSALNLTLPNKNQYAYMMEGFEKEWNYVGTQRRATYTNLDPGEYIFKVKASNNDLLWNDEPITLKIIIVPPFWRTWWFLTLLAISVVLLVFGIIKLRIKRIHQQKSELEVQVLERTLEISQQNEELEAQATNLKEANLKIFEKEKKLSELFMEMKDSIRAAEAIQKYMLPSDGYMKSLLPASFVFYKPKDVVSGDFYWCGANNNYKIFAAVDCTGHGVSGAFMSINAHHLLNKVILAQNEDLSAAEILNNLNEAILIEVYGEVENTELNHGMDIGLCVLDEMHDTLQFAGANIPLYLFRNNEITVIKGNRFSIGSVKDAKYTNHQVALKRNDMVYLFSDGYADQVGGKTGEQKFMYPRFRNLLREASHLEVSLQERFLEEEFQKWKGEQEQLDDILIMGVKIC